MKIIGISIIAILVIALCSDAKALEWVMCDTCTTDQHFEDSAKVRALQRPGYDEVWVGNTQTNRVHTVYTYTHTEGEVIAGDGGANSRDTSYSNERDAQVTTNLIVTVIGNYRASAETELQFASVILHAKSSVTVNDLGEPIILPIQTGFGSFSGRDSVAVSNYLWNTRGRYAYKPEPSTGGLTDFVTQALVIVVSPLGHLRDCLIFNNGDHACFKVPKSESELAEYLTGTAWDRYNTPIGTGGNHGGGGGSGYTAWPNGSQTRYGPVGYVSTGSLYKVCTFVDGVLHSCTYVHVP